MTLQRHLAFFVWEVNKLNSNDGTIRTIWNIRKIPEGDVFIIAKTIPMFY